jgi:putative phosphoribosyl transferase
MVDAKLKKEMKKYLVRLPINSTTILEGNLTVPIQSKGIVLFAHGSGSSRFSPRNRFVAERLNRDGIGKLLIDLLTRSEEEIDTITRHLRFDISLLSDRLIAATDWLIKHWIFWCQYRSCSCFSRCSATTVWGHGKSNRI